MTCKYCNRNISDLNWVSASVDGNFCSEAHALEATIEYNWSNEARKGGVN
jgi:hypothetical protein